MSDDKEIRFNNAVNENMLRLFEKGLPGNYDLEHLKRFNRELLSGTEKTYGGVLRSPVPEGFIYQRDREVMLSDNKKHIVTTVHSGMTDKDRTKLALLMKSLDPASDKRLLTVDFAHKISEFYVRSDYIHPFNDVNTRTLTLFISQYSRECGFVTPFDLGSDYFKNRDLFYISRARSVNRHAVKFADSKTMHAVERNMAEFTGYPYFSDFLLSHTYPERAKAFNYLLNDISASSDTMSAFCMNLKSSAPFVIHKYPELKEPSESLLHTLNAVIQSPVLDSGIKIQYFNAALAVTNRLVIRGHFSVTHEMITGEVNKQLNLAKTGGTEPER